MASVTIKDKPFGSFKSTNTKAQLKKLKFSPDVVDDSRKKTEPKPFHIPIRIETVHTAFEEFEQLQNALNSIFQINRDVLRKKTTFAQSIAYRVLGSIDWTRADFSQIEQVFKASSKKTLSISREQGKYIKLNEAEVKRGVYEWVLWRINFNNSLIESPEQAGRMSNLPPKSADDKISESDYLYMIAKWANDESCLDLGSYIHYGLPRARIRTRIYQDHAHVEKTQLNGTTKINQTTSTNSSGFLSASSIDFSNESNLTNVTMQPIAGSKIDSNTFCVNSNPK
jgi:hypothetical protein